MTSRPDDERRSEAPGEAWNERDAENYVLARGILTELIAAVGAAMDAQTDPAVTDRLRKQQERYMRERRTLTVTDQGQVRRVVSEYPAVLRKMLENGRR